MKKYLYATLLIMTLGLQGCILLAVGVAGLATAATAVINDRRSIDTLTEDNNLEANASSSIKQMYPDNTDMHIVVAAFNHAILLAGQVPSETVRHRIVSTLEGWPKVSHVYNQLEIASPTTASVRSNDTWITTKVKTTLLGTANLKSGQIKVLTENGTVYLMGIVSHSQADIAADTARRVEGVQRVVTLFEYASS